MSVMGECNRCVADSFVLAALAGLYYGLLFSLETLFVLPFMGGFVPVCKGARLYIKASAEVFK